MSVANQYGLENEQWPSLKTTVDLWKYLKKQIPHTDTCEFIPACIGTPGFKLEARRSIPDNDPGDPTARNN